MKCLLSVVPIFMIILLIMPMEFKIIYNYIEGSSRLNITTSYLFGIFKPEFYPFDKEKKDRNYKTGFLDRIKSIHKDDQYKEFIDMIWEKLVIKRVNWETKIGFEDAFYVGTIIGSLWFLKSLIVGFLLSKKEVEDLNYNVIPIFNKNQLEIIFDCIIKIRMVYIIIVWIWQRKTNKGGEVIGRTSNRRFNENYNE
ncbi:membrane hypothetical protein [[Clostridium] ultunense Esp]|uniref:DUF2953 domain-containing protein n=1 Tax=[Clostridium] ultunense Esp TaxID=1288971 RepID=M1YQ38_9FIRM|nr:DUF2953 domain-containing protein [Schnuerera ultunensis]CCQ92660.1 membrane hypothetical protein [[Clostridium] ultunense Esp]SHD77129.1 conserved membrane protein of unknown function [[Clostridium] ultunense Esp]